MNDRVSDCVSTISTLVLTLLFSPSIALAREKAEIIKTDISVQTADTISSQPVTELETVLDASELPLERVHFETAAIEFSIAPTQMVLPELAQIITPSEEPVSSGPQPAPLDSAISTAAADLKGESDELSRSHTPEGLLPVIEVAQSEPDVTPAEPTPAEAGGGNLAQQAQNPIANLISIPFQHNINFNVGPLDQTLVRPNAGADWTLRFQTTLLFPGG